MKARKLPSGNYICEGSYTDDDGIRHRQSFVSVDKYTAEIQAREYAHKKKASDRGSFSSAMSKFIKLSEPVLSPNTIGPYKSMQQALLDEFPAFCRLPVDQLDADDVQAVVNKLSSSRSPKTVRNYYGFISVVLKSKQKAVVGVRLPQKKKPVLNIPDTPTVKKIIKLTEGTELHIPILLAAIGTMRSAEICALQLDDISGDSIHVHGSMVRKDGKDIIKAPKTYESDRIVPLPHPVIELIQKQGYVTHLTPNAITKRFERLLKANDIPSFRFHDLRHFSASRMHAMGIPSAEIMRRGGWSTEATLISVYRHALDSREKADAKKINQQFSLLLR